VSYENISEQLLHITEHLLLSEILWVLLKQEIGGLIFIFITRKVGLDHHVLREAKSLQL
jgi:hypothetical protein